MDFIDGKVKVIVELKGTDTAAPVAQLLKRYAKKKGWGYQDFLVISFNHDEILKFHRLSPKVKIGLSFRNVPQDSKKFEEKIIQADYVVVPFRSVIAEFVGRMQEKGIKVLVYTVNKKTDINRVKNLGVDSIASDYPDRI